MSTPASAAPLSRVPAARRSIRPAFIAQSALIGGTVGIYGLVLLGTGGHQDVNAYLSGARDLLAGRPLFATFLHHPFPDPTLRPAFIYPPAFALLMSPLALLPSTAATLLWLAINQVALIVALAVAIRRLQPSRWALAAMIAATATFYPLWIDAVQGQANLLILLLVTLGLFGVLQRGPRFGSALGAAAALKLTPALFLLWLLVDRRWRAAAWMAGGFGVVSAIGALIRPADSITFFTSVLPALARGTAFYANQSVNGFLLRISSINPYTNPWIRLSLPVIVVAAIAALLVSWWAWRSAREPSLVRGVAFVPLLPLLSAVTWSHHLVVLLPVIWVAFVALSVRCWPKRLTALLIVILLGFDLLPRLPVGPVFGQAGFRAAQTGDLAVLLTANAFLLATLALFVAAPWLLRFR